MLGALILCHMLINFGEANKGTPQRKGDWDELKASEKMLETETFRKFKDRVLLRRYNARILKIRRANKAARNRLKLYSFLECSGLFRWKQKYLALLDQ